MQERMTRNGLHHMSEGGSHGVKTYARAVHCQNMQG